MDELTTQQILEKIGLKSARTLRRWSELGLIAGPVVKPHPGGRGRIAHWPASIINRCVEIREKIREGLTLEEIGKIPVRRQYRFQDDWDERNRRLELLRLRETVTKSLRRFCRNSLELLDHQLVSREQLLEARRLAAEGHEIYLVVQEAGSSVTTKANLNVSIASQSGENILAIIAISHLILGPGMDLHPVDDNWI